MSPCPNDRLDPGVIYDGGLLTSAIRFAMNSEKLALLLTREMPYGKYKGRMIADLPGHYLDWFAREGFPSGELGALIALMYELDHNDLRALLDPLRR
ncbi:hypothetical protein SAMN05428959_101864 [Duganella sp. CF517]|nr:hypothetical protein SAMN05428959_101864 [Duganella sp. CF517]